MTHPYQNASLPVHERVADLIGRMTLEEKVAQLHGLLDIQQIAGDGNRFSPEAAGRVCPHTLRTVAVIGPNAAELRLGGYAGTPQHGVTILEGIRRHLGDRVEVRYAEGCRITETAGRSSFALWKEEQVVLPDPDEDAARIAEAVALARSVGHPK